MPTYLLHGFRWPRPLIRIHIVMQDMDDAAPEWLVAPGTTLALQKNFTELYPECMRHLKGLRFIEQHDPNDVSAAGVSQPYAYVADMVEEVKLGRDIDEVRGKGLNNDQWAAIMDLRDKLAPDEKVGWFVVVCGDEDRPLPTPMDPIVSSGADLAEIRKDAVGVDSRPTTSSRSRKKSPGAQAIEAPEVYEPTGFKKLASLRLGRKKM